jgi:hypothetical protein
MEVFQIIGYINMDFEYIVLNPKEVQNLLDCIDIIPSNHYICISRNIDNDRVYVGDLGKNGRDKEDELEITENYERI